MKASTSQFFTNGRTVRRIGRTVPILLALTLLAGCQALRSDKVSVDYYSIDGDSTAALDREIKSKGPKIDGGRHAVAVARIRIIPNVTYRNSGVRCRVREAKVAVKANVTLPTFKGRDRASKELRQAWDNIDRYTRMHEAVHVGVAFRFAREMEEAILKQPPASSCDALRAGTNEIYQRLLKEHDNTQRKFDEDENKRLSMLSKRTG